MKPNINILCGTNVFSVTIAPLYKVYIEKCGLTVASLAFSCCEAPTPSLIYTLKCVFSFNVDFSFRVKSQSFHLKM
jgi:hypothetical protein